ncbi:MAG: hypothetical protein AAFU85_33315, partial [Planctomycetota bacterium]
CLEEAKWYPPRFFAELGLKKIGVFAACASITTTDSHRRFDAQLGGYRYFGVYNGRDGLAAAHYSDGQLAMTFHHEVFHHVDSTLHGETGAWNLGSDDAFYQAALSSKRPYRAAPVVSKDVQLLRKKCFGITLKDFVSTYAVKNYREDQAETARHVMSFLPDALLQAIERPELAGSQRILHVLREYEQSVEDGPTFDWFVDAALERADRSAPIRDPEALIARLSLLTESDVRESDKLSEASREIRSVLRSVVRMDASLLSAGQVSELSRLSVGATHWLLRNRIRPDERWVVFDVWGSEDRRGVNQTLRHDVAQFGRDARRLGWIVRRLKPESRDQATTRSSQLKGLRGLARYYVFLRRHWSVTRGTTQVFEDARHQMVEALLADEELADAVRGASLIDLARRIQADGSLNVK